MTHIYDPKTGEILDANQALDDFKLEDLDPSIQGTNSQMNFELGSAFKVAQSTLKVKVPDLNIVGQFQDGDVVHLTIAVEVEDVSFKSIKDRGGNQVGKERIHKGVAIETKLADQ